MDMCTHTCHMSTHVCQPHHVNTSHECTHIQRHARTHTSRGHAHTHTAPGHTRYMNARAHRYTPTRERTPRARSCEQRRRRHEDRKTQEAGEEMRPKFRGRGAGLRPGRGCPRTGSAPAGLTTAPRRTPARAPSSAPGGTGGLRLCPRGRLQCHQPAWHWSIPHDFQKHWAVGVRAAGSHPGCRPACGRQLPGTLVGRRAPSSDTQRRLLGQ